MSKMRTLNIAGCHAGVEIAWWIDECVGRSRAGGLVSVYSWPKPVLLKKEKLG